MPLDTFDPVVCPNLGSSREVSTRVKSAQFGDGYSQRAIDGLNSVNRTFSVEWPILTTAQATAIEDFFIAKGGATAFLYKAPKEAAAMKWICQKWRRISISWNREALNASFEQVFDL